MNNTRCRRPTHSRITTAVVSGAVAIVIVLARTSTASGASFLQEVTKPAETQKDPDAREAVADRKLLADLEHALDRFAEHFDDLRLDRELATAFRVFGIDLENVPPKVAGAELAGRPATPEIAAVLDEWGRIRRTRLNVSTWVRLVETARKADPDPWRNSIRDQYGRSAAESLPVLRARDRREPSA